MPAGGGAPIAAGPSVGGPSASPMLTPQKAAGHIASAKAKVQVAQKILQLAMLECGIGTPQGKAILKGLHALVSEFGKTEEEDQKLMPAEMMQAMQSQAGPGAQPPKPAAPPTGPAGAPPTMQ